MLRPGLSKSRIFTDTFKFNVMEEQSRSIKSVTLLKYPSPNTEFFNHSMSQILPTPTKMTKHLSNSQKKKKKNWAASRKNKKKQSQNKCLAYARKKNQEKYQQISS